MPARGPIDPELLAILAEDDVPPEPGEPLPEWLTQELDRRLADPAEQVGIPYEEVRALMTARIHANAARRRAVGGSRR